MAYPLASLSEPQKGMVLDSALLKQLVGGDTIKARGIFEKTFTYKPDFKINHWPCTSFDNDCKRLNHHYTYQYHKSNSPE